MGARGPKPASRLAVIKPKTVKRPNPPAGMEQRPRNLFKKIVNANTVDTFDAETVVMLAAFCDMEHQRYLAAKKVNEFGAVIQNEVYVPPDLATFGDPDAPEIPKQYTFTENPWYKIMKETTSSMATLSTKLRKKGVSTDKSQVEVSSRKGLMFEG
jgi:phage terminase small subunit